MEQSVDLKLRQIIDQHGRLLLDDPGRCEACLGDADLADRDLAALSAAVKQGVCRRLLALPEGAFGPQTLTAFAAELAEQSGLKEDLCRRAVEAWAYACRLDGATAGNGAATPMRPKVPQPADRPDAVDSGPGDQARGPEVAARPAPAFSVGDLAMRLGLVFGTAVVGTIAGTIVALLLGVVQSVLTNRGVMRLDGAFAFGLGWVGAAGAICGAAIGRDTAKERGRESSRGVDAAAWIVAILIALYCLSVLFGR